MPSRSPIQQPLTLVCYGSLMSGLGLVRVGSLAVTGAARVRLLGCRRGFGKLSMYGDRFAMVLEPLAPSEPIRAELVTPETPLGTEPEGIALTMPLGDLARVAAHEGYSGDVIEALARTAAARGRTLAEDLWAILERADGDTGAFRRALFAAAGYTSAHHVPHPILLAGAPALAFLPPGPEGSGSDDVVPVRVRTALDRLLGVREVWRVKPNADQLDYLAMCLLAEAHNVSLADVCAGLAEDRPLAALVRARLARELPGERARYRATLGLDAESYASCFQSGPRRAAFLTDEMLADADAAPPTEAPDAGRRGER